MAQRRQLWPHNSTLNRSTMDPRGFPLGLVMPGWDRKANSATKVTKIVRPLDGIDHPRSPTPMMLLQR